MPEFVYAVQCVHISPVKTSRNNAKHQYFDGGFLDGSKTVMVVSFNLKLRPQVEQSMKTSHGVSLINCVVKRSHEAGDLGFNVFSGKDPEFS